MMNHRTIAFFILSSLFFGGTFVAAKAGLEYFPPLLFVALRFDIAAIVLLAYVLATVPRSELLPSTRDDLIAIAATGGLVIGLANAFLFVGQQYATSAVAAIIFSLNPILTPVFAAILLSDERLSVRGAIGMAVGLVGVVFVINPDPAIVAGGDAIGPLIVFAGAASAAIGSVLIRRTENGTLSSTVRIAWGLPLAAVLTHGFALGAGESAAAIDWTLNAVIALAYVSIFAGVLAYAVYFALLDSAGAIRSNLVFYVVPVVSAIGGWALLDERLTELTVVGFLTIFAGFAILGSESIDIRSRLPGLPHRPADSQSREEPRGFRSD